MSAGLIAACAPETPEETAETEAPAYSVPVTAAFAPVEGGASALAFIPDADAPGASHLVGAAGDGGLNLFNLGGSTLNQMPGPRLSSLAVAPEFDLRGQDLPLIFGVNASDNSVLAWALDRESSQFFPLPVMPILVDGGASALCLYREGPGFVEIAALGVGATAELWRVRDEGEELLAAERLGQIELPAPSRACVADDGDLILASPSAGLVRITPDAEQTAQTVTPAQSLILGNFAGRQIIVASDGVNDALSLFDARTLEPLPEMSIEASFATEGVGRAGALALEANNLGTTYSGGALAVYDSASGRIVLVARIAFANALLSASADR